MKKTKTIYLLLALSFAACMTPHRLPGLPEPDLLPFETKGAQIRVVLSNQQIVQGELIASNTDRWYLLVMDSSGVNKIYWENISRYNVFYAQGKNLRPPTLIFALATLSHGWFLLLTLPVNLAVAISANYGDAYEYSVRKKDITLRQLNLFARYPQGLPEGLHLNEIR